MPSSAPAETAAAVKQVAVAGNPNSGKTTLFNRLTGLHMKVANYPGVTVEKREAHLTKSSICLLDLPGVYSLSARAPDEELARDILQGRIQGTRRPDAVLIVIDATNLERNLYLATQILEFGAPAIVACNMMDSAKESGLHIDCGKLSEILGVPVIPTVASRGDGVDEVREAVLRLQARKTSTRGWQLPPVFEDAITRVADAMKESAIVLDRTARAGGLLWLTDYLSGDDASRLSARKFLERLEPTAAAVLREAAEKLQAEMPDATTRAIEGRYGWVAQIANQVVGGRAAETDTPNSAPHDRSEQIDRIVLHRVLGPIIFAAVMVLLFFALFSWAEPMMLLLERGQNALASSLSPLLPEGPVRSLVIDGIVGGVGAVLSFFPQIWILFFCLAALEDSGYFARAAFLVDRLMSRVGLHGKSFIPLLSCHACAIPGILATRTIENRRDRFTTIMVAPFMSCSARLPIYVIVISAVFGNRTLLKTGVMAAMYLLGMLTALVMAMIFKRTIFAGPRPPFIMEMPRYHVPQLGGLLRTTWDRSKLFLTNAGTIIFAACIVIWALSYFPRSDVKEFSPEVQARLAALPDGDEARESLIASEHLRLSWLGRLGRTIEPALEPLGFDWRLGVGILSSFLAREVFVGTMGITLAVGEADSDSISLRDKMRDLTWPDGRRLLTPLVAIGLLVFYVLACQCVSTLAVVKKETASWRWPAFMFFYMTTLAYIAALGLHQAGRWLRIGS